MKVMCFTNYEVSKLMEIAPVMDQVMMNLPQVVKVLGRWGVCGPLPGYPLGTTGGLSLIEAETTEAVAAFLLPVCLTGACSFVIPVMELPTEVTKLVEELKG